MEAKISVVINTLNEAKNISRAIKSVQWADEVIVCDMHSDDETVKIAKDLGAKVVFHERTSYVEPARNFAIKQATNDWIFILDADEETPKSLGKKLRQISQENRIDYLEIPRKNIIFNKWLKASGWWPDYNIRFFKKGTVVWKDEIHSKPKVSGQELKLEVDEDSAIIHYNYSSLSQYLLRMDRYSTIQAKELDVSHTKFLWTDLFTKPLGEFLSRFFVNRGYDDGLHGLALALLQAFSILMVYLKLWEIGGFKEEEIKLNDVEKQAVLSYKELRYWFRRSDTWRSLLHKTVRRVQDKLL